MLIKDVMLGPYGWFTSIFLCYLLSFNFTLLKPLINQDPVKMMNGEWNTRRAWDSAYYTMGPPTSLRIYHTHFVLATSWMGLMVNIINI